MKRGQAARACKRAIYLVGRGLREPAVHLFHMAVAADPSYGYGWADLGTCLMELERYEEAYEALQRATQLISNDGITWLHQRRVAMSSVAYPTRSNASD